MYEVAIASQYTAMIANSDDFIIVHGMDPERWAKRYDIEPFSTDCYECGATKKTTIPFFIGTLRGLLAPPCPCGSASRTYCIVRAPGEGPLFQMPEKPRKRQKKRKLKLVP